MLVQHKAAPGPSEPRTEAGTRLPAPREVLSKHSVYKLLMDLEIRLRVLEALAAQQAIMALHSLQAELRAGTPMEPICRERVSLIPTPEQVRSMSSALVFAKQRAAEALTLEQVQILFGPIQLELPPSQ